MHLSEGDKKSAWRVCYAHLPKVSRTFALSILGLKEPLKGAVAVSYLICRILDTFEDAPGLSTAQRASLVHPFLDAAVAGELPARWWLDRAEELLDGRSTPNDLQLVGDAGPVLKALFSCPRADRLAISRWVEEMGRGMIETSALMGPGSGLKTLPDMVSLDRYCYYIAGTVGYMLTDLFYLESPHIDECMYFELQRDAEAFGLGLQKVNIVKDFADDYRRGWCFLPLADIEREDLTPADLLDTSKGPRIYRALQPVLASASAHLLRGWRYLELVPLEEREIRLFLAYSLFFAVKTLAAGVEKPTRFTSEAKLKISRGDVVSLMAACRGKVDDPPAFRSYFERLFEPLAPIEKGYRGRPVPLTRERCGWIER